MTVRDHYVEGLALWELEAVAAINALESKVDIPEAEASDLRWQQAEQVVNALDAGMSLRKLASNWKRPDGSSYSHMHVERVKRTWTVTLGLQERPRWNDVYHSPEVRKKTPGESPGILDSAGEPTEGLFATIVIDPPWRYENVATRGAAEDHYPTMSLGELEELEIPAADNAHLYLWVTNAFLSNGFDLLVSWGFEYKTCLTWCKPSIGLGNYFRNNTEHVLFGVRGRAPTLRNDIGTWFEAKKTRHSAKPESFYDLVEACSTGPYLEMFARRRRFGWHVWGDEA